VRNAFLSELFELASAEPRIVFVTGDLGFSVVEEFMEALPKQFVNAGVAEQNMTAMAAGMALCGKIVFTYSIANFPTLRCLEQVRNDVCYHDANVTVVSIGGGFAYGTMGATHHATEDLGVMRVLPNMTIVAPGDPIEARAATRALVEHKGPAYLRLGKAGEPIVHETPIDFELGRSIELRAGDDATLFSTGGTLELVVRAADALADDGISTRVVSMHTLKPLDEAAVLAAARETAVVVTIEEHSVIGGLGSAVAEVLAEQFPNTTAFRRIGIPASFSAQVGTQEYLRAENGIAVEPIRRTVKELLKGPRARAAGG
jgi:transketolase